jgi:hypothetical protein
VLEPLYRFSKAAIDEMNKQSQPETKKEFALLMIGLATLLALLYAQIIW